MGKEQIRKTHKPRTNPLGVRVTAQHEIVNPPIDLHPDQVLPVIQKVITKKKDKSTLTCVFIASCLHQTQLNELGRQPVYPTSSSQALQTLSCCSQRGLLQD